MSGDSDSFESRTDEIVQAVEALKERIQPSEDLTEAWAVVETLLAKLLALQSASVDPRELRGLEVRWAFYAETLKSAMEAFEILALRLSPNARVETFVASARQQLEASRITLDDLSDVDDLELRRMVTAYEERLKGMRALLADMERHAERVAVSGTGTAAAD